MALDLKKGDLIEVMGFPCIEQGTIRMVNVTHDNKLYFVCGCGQHLIDDEVEESMRRHFVSITKANG